MTARGSGTPDPHQAQHVLQQFASLGVPAAQAQAMLTAGRSTEDAGAGVTLARHLWPAVELAMALRTQVRVVVGQAGQLLHLGLDYARLDGTKRDLGLPMRGPRARTLLRQFRVVENEMMSVLNTARGGALGG